MPLANTKNMLKEAVRGGYAVGAFNAENMETLQAIIRAAEETGSPVIVQTTPGSVRYAGAAYFAAMALAAAKSARIEIALHIDHGEDFEACERGMAAGYTSVMIDGSKLALEENITLTRKVVEAARGKGITVEAELGTLAGKEDDAASAGCRYTVPAEAARFVSETGVDSLAVAIGTAHGLYAAEPVLNMKLTAEIKGLLPDTPLVLHGASGLSDGCVRECVRLGMAKVNFATELRCAFSWAVRAYFEKDPAVIDPKKYLSPARDAVITVVKEKIRVLGCAGKSGR
ncbi:MAG: class II fructose-bisphosphate aldolase [Clostridiales bacterium]|jgi:tagatose 1,6-diphosphate aldolase GatY/KbaY|nr:class II fructose-bisphosphate aldolase [Clostridiales bacterium]